MDDLIHIENIKDYNIISDIKNYGRGIVIGGGTFGVVKLVPIITNDELLLEPKLDKTINPLFCNIYPNNCVVSKIITKKSKQKISTFLKNTINEILIMTVLAKQKKEYSKYFSKIKDYKITDDKVVIIMDKGLCSLDTLIKDYKKIDIKLLLSLMLKITKALEILHKLNIIHYDIKPNNIIISDKDFNIKLIDFGLALFIKDKKLYKLTYKNFNEKIEEKTIKHDSTNTNLFLDKSNSKTIGTISYMAPELYPNMSETKEESKEDSKEESEYIPTKNSDIWSLGITFITLICGFNPVLFFGWYDNKSSLYEFSEKVINKKFNKVPNELYIFENITNNYVEFKLYISNILNIVFKNKYSDISYDIQEELIRLLINMLQLHNINKKYIYKTIQEKYETKDYSKNSRPNASDCYRTLKIIEDKL